MDNQVLAELAQAFESEVPDAAQRIHRSLGDETFFDMCMEYEECTRCLRRWTTSPNEHRDRINEYTELLMDLQQEILRYLHEHR